MNKMALWAVCFLLLAEALAAPQFDFSNLSNLADFGSSSSSKNSGWFGTSATGSIIHSGTNGSPGSGSTRHATPSNIGQLFGQTFNHHLDTLAQNPNAKTR